MGTWGGHVLPGSFFVVFGVWWTISMFRRYYKSLVKGGEPFQSTLTFPCACLCGRLKRWPIEAALKVFFTVVGFTGEIITAHEHGKFVHLGNGQHATMFFFFGLSGVVDILVHNQVPLPRGIDYLMAGLAFAVEALLFKFHLHGRNSLDVLVHTLLLYVVYISVVQMMLEMRFRGSMLCSLVRAYLILVQGTWFWQVAFILYPPINPEAHQWEGENHEHMMIITMMFAWHLGAVFLFMMTIGAIIGCYYRCRGDFDMDGYDALSMKLIKKRSNGNTIVNINNDSDLSDVEFERPLVKK